MIFTTFGDMMRVPASNGSLLDAKARRRRPHGLFAAGRAQDRPREPRPRGRLLRDRLRDHRSLHRADRAARPPGGIRNFSLFCNHVTIIPAIRAILDSPDLRLDGFVGPGHVSTVIGLRPYRFIAADYGKPVVSRASSRSTLQGVYMILRQLGEGRSEVENQYSRVVREEGNPLALKALAETMELRTTFEWRGLGFISQSAEAPRGVRRLGRRGPLRDPGVRVADPKACQCGEVLKGVIKPWECKVFGTACTPTTRSAPAWSRARAPARPTTTTGATPGAAGASPPPRAADGRERVRLRPLRGGGARRDRGAAPPPAPQAARRADHTLARGGRQVEPRPGRCADPARAAQPAAGAARRQRPAGAGRRRRPRLAFTTDSFVVKPLFFPGGDIGELAVNGTVNDLAMAGATPLALSCGFIIEEGLPVAELERIVASMAGRRGRRVRIATGDTKVVERGKADGVYINTSGVGLIEHELELGLRGSGPATECWSRARSATTGWRS